jgi:hypothetical protein
VIKQWFSLLALLQSVRRPTHVSVGPGIRENLQSRLVSAQSVCPNSHPLIEFSLGLAALIFGLTAQSTILLAVRLLLLAAPIYARCWTIVTKWEKDHYLWNVKISGKQTHG